MGEIKVLVVDDSLFFRETLARKLKECGGIEVIDKAHNAFEARDKIAELHPDVVTLDIEMPGMNGIEFLRKLIPENPVPVIVVTSSPINAFDAICAGAVEYIKKPMVQRPEDMNRFVSELCTKIKIAKLAKVRVARKPVPTQDTPSLLKNLNLATHKNTIIALGASTGGTDALQRVLAEMPKDVPPIVVVQHMPAGFTKMYAERLNRTCEIEVKEAVHGDRLTNGTAIIAAGEFQLRIAKDTKGYYITSKRENKVSGHCPSVDVLFDSVAQVAKKDAIGAIMTGMGSDGAKGLLNMRKAGAYTIGQDKESSVVYGMPMVAFNIGAVEKQAPLEQIGSLILEKLK